MRTLQRPQFGTLMKGGAHPALPFSANFAMMSDGALPARFQGAGNTWAIATAKAVNTPTLGNNLIANGTFDADSGWTKGSGWAIGSGVATGTNTTGIIYAPGIAAKTWYQSQVDIVSRTLGYIYGYLGGTSLSGHTTPGTYIDTNRSGAGTNAGYQGGSNFSGTIDNVIVKAITLAEMFRTIEAKRPDVDISANATLLAGTQAGVVVCLDSVSSPANFIFAYHDGVNAHLEKCVAGTYTSLINLAATYAANGAVRVVTTISGSNLLVDLFYNGSQVGSRQTVSDAGIVANTKHGLFSTYSGNSFSFFSVTTHQ